MDIVSQLVINSIVAGSMYALIAVGFNLIYGTTKFFNIAHGILPVIAGYTVFFLFTISGINLFLSVLIGILLAGISGLLAERLIFLRLRRRKAKKITMFIASLGLFTALQSVIAIFFTSQFQTLTDFSTIQKTYEIYGGIIAEIHIVIIITLVFMTTGLILVLNKTTFGKAVKAITDDEDVARIIGINTDRIIGYVFFIGSAMAGIAGILAAFDIGLLPGMGLKLVFKGVLVATIIGGVGNIYGGVLGAFLLGFIENISAWMISGQWKDAIIFILLVIFLLFRPQGMLGK